MSNILDYDVQDLPDTELKKSPTWVNNVDQCGNCTKCGEHASLLDYCCSGMFHFEGGVSSSQDLWSDIEYELKEQAEAKAYDSLENELTGN